MKEESDSSQSKGLIIALVISIIILLSLVGYIFYDKVIIRNQNFKQENKIEDISDYSKNEEQIVDIHDDLIQNLYSSNLIKLRIAYENISKQNITSVECSKLELSESAYCGSMNGLMREAYNNGDLKKFQGLKIVSLFTAYNYFKEGITTL